MSFGRAPELSDEPVPDEEPLVPVADEPPLVFLEPDAEAPEEPEPVAAAEPTVLVTPSASTARTPLEIVEVVWQFEDEGVKKADDGVMVSPTV